MPRTADLRIRSTTPLLSPETLAAEIPLPDATAAFIHQARREIAAVLAGTNDRLVVVVGPCSMHDPIAALDYASRLRPAAERLCQRRGRAAQQRRERVGHRHRGETAADGRCAGG